MAIYILLLLVIPAYSLAERRALAARHIALWFALTIFIGLRLQVGGDWDNYLRLFEDAAGESLSETLFARDPGYRLLNRLAAVAGAGIWAVNLVCAAVFAAGLVSLVRAQPRPTLALLISVPVMIMILGLTFSRQSIAAGFLMWGLARASAGRDRQAAGLIALAPLFHWSALLLLPIGAMGLIDRPVPLRRLAGLLLAAFSAAMLAALLFKGGAISALDLPGAARGASIRAVPTAAAALLCLAALDRMGFLPGERNAMAAFTLLAILALLAGFVLPTAADRLGLYLTAFHLVVFARASALVAPGVRRSVVTTGIAAAFVAYFVFWLSYTRYAPCFAPYRSFVLEPHLAGAKVIELRRKSPACQAVQTSSRL